MSTKGFTLVELLGVVAILMILAVIIAPKVISEISNSEDVALKTQINEIIEVSKIYMNQNTNLLSDEEAYIITFAELKKAGLIEYDKIINPKTNNELIGCVTVEYINNKYQYEYVEDSNICNK